MAETQTRIRWNPQEKADLANEMVRLQSLDPSLSLLDALRSAQSVLDEDRRREVKQWSAFDSLLADHINVARIRLGAAPAVESAEGAASKEETALAPTVEPKAATTTSALAAEPEVHPAQTSAAVVEAQQAPVSTPSTPLAAPVSVAVPSEPSKSAVAGLDTLRVEAALLAALESPVVEAAVVKLFSKAMAEAFGKLSASDKSTPAESEARASSLRVLLAGFAGPQAKSLEEALHEYEVRVWKPNQGQQLFETLASICNVAVIPESVSDDVDENLKSFNLKVLRHEGSPARLAERIEEAC